MKDLNESKFAPEGSDWKLLGQGKPTETVKSNMKGVWTIRWGNENGKSLGKFKENTILEYKDFFEEEILEELTMRDEGLGNISKSTAAAGLIGLSALGGASDVEAKPSVTPHEPTSQPSPTSDSSFIEYIKATENSIKKGYDKKKGLWFPYKSYEGGAKTIAYGHKIKKGEDFNKGISDADAMKLLKSDIEIARKTIYRELGNVRLTQKQEEMLIDITFNLGTLRSFPKFVRAVLKGDVTTMKRQYKRYVNGAPLKTRNQMFYNKFLS